MKSICGKKLGTFLISIVILSFFSCKLELGMGETVDLEAPVVKVTSPSGYAKVHSDVTFSGTCSDNTLVTLLTITEQSSGQVYGKINNPPANWTFKPTSPLKEGYHTLLFTVEDAAGNEGSTSRVALSFTVDDTAPEGKRFQIRRPNYTFTDFKDYDYLKNLEYTYINMDYFQNGEFSIVGEFEDDIGVSEIKFSIFDREDLQNPVLVKTVKAGIEDKNSEFYVDNINTPVVTVKASELIAKNSKYENTKSFLYITCISFDEHGNVNSEPFKLGYLIWDPDSDKPQFKPTGFTLDDDGNLKVPASTAIKFDIFDDDGIKEVYYKIYQENDTLPNSNKDIIDDTNKKFEPADYPLLITTNDYTSASSYTTNYLVWTVVDKSGTVSNSGRIKITIDDQKIPTLTIVSPEKNTIPAFDSSLKNESGVMTADYVRFAISGYGVDTNSCVSIKMAYLKPGYTATMDVIKSNFSSVTEVSNEFTQVGDAYYKVGKLNANGQANGGNKYNFTFDIDLTNDKDTNGNKVFDYTSNKTFIFELIDNDNNKVYETCTYNPDIQAVKIYTVKPTVGTVCDYYSPMNVILCFPKVNKNGKPVSLTGAEASAPSEFVFTGVKPIKSVSIKLPNSQNTELIDYVKCDSNGNENMNGNFYKFTISKDCLKEFYDSEKKSPSFEINAKDIYDIESTDRVYISLADVPQLNEISSSEIDKVYAAGDKITLEAKFSSSVTYNETPTLTVKYKVDGEYKTEDLTTKTLSGNDVLQFEFNVPQKTSGELESVSFNGTVYSANLSTAKAITEINTGCHLHDKKNIVLDGYAPVVKYIGLSSLDGVLYESKRYLSREKKILATVRFDENISTILPQLKLNWDSTDVLFNVNTVSENTIIFEHEVSSTTPELTTDTEITFVGFIGTGSNIITDVPGNEYVKNDCTPANTTVIVDTTKPAAPGIQIDGEDVLDSYNADKKLKIKTSDIEPGAHVEYTIDGQNWYEYTDTIATNGIALTKGNVYSVRTKQTDIAGNTSDSSDVTRITIEGFPEVQSFALITPEGKNTATSLVFKMSFASEINAPAGAATITFSSIKKNAEGASINKTVSNTAVNNSREVEFTYLLTDENNKDDIYQGVEVSKVEFTSSFKDHLGNIPDFASETVGGVTKYVYKNKDSTPLISKQVYYDKTAPKIKAKTENIAPSTFAITLEFSEEVSPEYGTVTIERNGDWLVPAILTTDEFNKYYNACDDDKKAALLETELINGEYLDKKDSKTGISVGPYKKITHGLNVPESGIVTPNIDTTYVLDFNKGLNDETIRAALASANYHKHSVDITNSDYVKPVKVSGIDDKTRYTIQFPDSIAKGIEWKVTIPAGLFRDECGNTSEALSGTYTIWSAGVSDPVIRVDRYSHGYGAKGQIYNSSTKKWEEANITSYSNPSDSPSPQDNTGGKIKPLDYVRVRIDSQTPGVSIRYKQTTKTITEATKSISSGGTTRTGLSYETIDQKHTPIVVADATKSEIDKTSFTGNTLYSAQFNVGDSDIYKPRKDYFAAVAQKTHDFKDSTNNSVVQTSATTYEGAFRTVVVVDQHLKTNGDKQLNVDGGTSRGGRPLYSGFPLRDGWSVQYSKNMYFDEAVTLSNDKHPWVWCSYELLTEDICLLLRFANDNSSTYPLVSYGEGVYLYNYNFYNH